MLERKVVVGEEIIKQGDEGDFFYLVDAGTFEILVRLKKRKKETQKETRPTNCLIFPLQINGNKVAECKAGQSFGELALLYSQPRAATVKATSEATVWAVDRSTFRRIVLGSNARKRLQYQTFLKVHFHFC